MSKVADSYEVVQLDVTILLTNTLHISQTMFPI